jgi:hypothetical protein
MAEHLRSVLWQRLDLPGGEYCSLWRAGDGWRLAGVAVAAFDGRPLRADYVVECDAAWRAREATLVVVAGAEERRLHLRADGDGAWSLDGRPVDAVRGCADVDLNVTPATNTLPIRRLNLAVGASAEVVAAWVRFPELTVEPLWQRYTRLSADRYHYESDGGYATEFVADDLGLLRVYEGGWRRVSEISPPPSARSE